MNPIVLGQSFAKRLTLPLLWCSAEPLTVIREELLYAIENLIRRNHLSFTGTSHGELELAFGQRPFTNGDAQRHAEQFHLGKFDAGTFGAIVHENGQARCPTGRVELFGGLSNDL